MPTKKVVRTRNLASGLQNPTQANEVRILPLSQLRSLKADLFVDYLTNVLNEEIKIYKELKS